MKKKTKHARLTKEVIKKIGYRKIHSHTQNVWSLYFCTLRNRLISEMNTQTKWKAAECRDYHFYVNQLKMFAPFFSQIIFWVVIELACLHLLRHFVLEIPICRKIHGKKKIHTSIREVWLLISRSWQTALPYIQRGVYLWWRSQQQQQQQRCLLARSHAIVITFAKWFWSKWMNTFMMVEPKEDRLSTVAITQF